MDHSDKTRIESTPTNGDTPATPAKEKNAGTGAGGAQTNINGLAFEKQTSLKQALIEKGFIVKRATIVNPAGNAVHIEDAVYDEEGEIVRALLLEQGKLQKWMKDFYNISMGDVLSKKLRPDEALYYIETKTLHILEKKWQQTSGSVDEKLQTCVYKRHQYERLAKAIDPEMNVTFAYICNDWFRKTEYKDVFTYMADNNIKAYFNEVPLEDLGFPNQI